MITVFQWSRITAQLVDFTLTPTLADGSPATGIAVQCALLPYRSRGPDALTVWTAAATWTDGVGGAPGTGQIFVAGPDANPGAGLLMGDYGNDMWAQIVDNPDTEPQFICRFDLQADPRPLF